MGSRSQQTRNFSTEIVSSSHFPHIAFTMPRFMLFGDEESPTIGVVVGTDSVASISAAMAAEGLPDLRGSMRAFLTLGADETHRLARAATLNAPRVPLAGCALLAPIYDPQKVVCVGMNYVDHCTEQNIPVPTEPLLFSKFASAIARPGADLPLAPEVGELDWEVELTIVIGKRARRVSEADAMEYVAGYTVAHDVSARDWQLKKNGGQWLVGKTLDGYLPLGPAIVTPEELSDVRNLGIRTRVNGELVQDSNTREMVFHTEAVVAWCSKFFTLLPGDVICTGTPPGVGCFRTPQWWLKAGDVVEVEIDEIGTISNTVVAEKLTSKL